MPLPDVGSASYVLGPLVALVAVGLIMLLCRWAFSGGQSVVRRPVRHGSGTRDYGLLESVATVRTAQDAALLRDVLASHGIRATVSAASTETDPGRLHVLVFHTDATPARALVGTRS